MGEISGETIFIDGTKIEASANKYTFVWKKAVTKNQAKLLQKLADFVAECEQLYDLRIVYGNTIKIKHVKRLRKKLYASLESAYFYTPLILHPYYVPYTSTILSILVTPARDACPWYSEV